jgi:hypothetical protein
MRHVLPAALVATLSLAGCGSEDATTVVPDHGGSTADGVVVLAKAPGWRRDLSIESDPFAVLEIALDQAIAEVAWAENVPRDLPVRSGPPAEPGVYGSIDVVDFDQQVVAVWSAGESRSCPGWLADVHTHDDGGVELVGRDTNTLSNGGSDGILTACTSDYNSYRLVLAIDRDKLPDPADLPVENVTGVPDGLVTTYPAGD